MPLPKTTNLFMAGYRKDPPLLPRLPDNQPNFHRQSENIHTRDTHDTPFPKQRRNTRITETPTKPVTARFLSIPKDTKQNNHGKLHYPIDEELQKPFTHSRQTTQTQQRKESPTCHYSIHGEEQSPKRREHPIEEPPQNERNHIHRQRKQHTQFTNRNSRRIEHSGRSEH